MKRIGPCSYRLAVQYHCQYLGPVEKAFHDHQSAPDAMVLMQTKVFNEISPYVFQQIKPQIPHQIHHVEKIKENLCRFI